WCNPEKLSIQVDFLQKNSDYVLCYGDYEEIFADGSHFSLIKTLYESGDIFNNLLFQFDISIITTMLRNSLLKESGLQFDSHIKASEEYCLFMQLASRYKIGVIKKVLAKYRVHASSLTSASLSILGYERRYTLNKILENNPSLKESHKEAFKEAYARADYYDSRWFMSQKKHLSAFKSLANVAFVSKRYFALLLLTLFPSIVWDKIHLKKRNRT
ncbi:MAG: glycosyl transferase, partial [Sediminibacterium sp.]|nr:glycosyl transferase [Sediminibacterium sp.]